MSSAWSQSMSEIVCLFMLIFVCSSIYPSHIEKIPSPVFFSLAFLSHFWKKTNRMRQREDREKKGEKQIKQGCAHCCCIAGFFSPWRLCSPTPLCSLLSVSLTHSYPLYPPPHTKSSREKWWAQLYIGRDCNMAYVNAVNVNAVGKGFVSMAPTSVIFIFL